MRTLLATLALVLSAGCIVHVPPPVQVESRKHEAEKRCPPGHEWSDGRCHERGRGHDREERRR